MPDWLWVLDTPDMPRGHGQLMKAVKWDKITARDVTDTERRAMCVIAGHFGTAYELWAKDPIEDPYREEEEAKPTRKGKKAGNQKTPTQAQSPLSQKRIPLMLGVLSVHPLLLDIYQNQKDASVVIKFRKYMKLRFNGTLRVEERHLKVEHLTTEEMVANGDTDRQLQATRHAE